MTALKKEESSHNTKNSPEKIKNYIGGEWVRSETAKYKEVRNPATNEVIAKVPMSTKKEAEGVVEIADQAFSNEWRNLSINERIDPLFKYVEVLEKNQEEISKTLVKEHGKEWDAAMGEMKRTIQMVQSACSVFETQKGDFTENVAKGIDEYSVLRPLGVFGMIPPFNFPAMVPWWFIPFALAVGDTYVLKANEQCPMTQNHMFKLIDNELDLPDGVVNLINGGSKVGQSLIENPKVEGISFVGSTPVAREIYKNSAKEGKRVQAQAGANNFHVVMPDANLEKTTDNLLGPYWGNTGQRCLAGSIIIAVGDVYEEVKEKFINKTKKLNIGYGLNKETEIGPVISSEALRELKKTIDKGLDEGAEMLLDGRDIEVSEFPEGNFLGPTVFEGAEPGMELFDEEVFGPVACITKAANLDEAIRTVNNDKFGNAITIYTESGANARKFRNQVKVGNVGINIGTVAPMSYYPFGGMKESFFGDLHGQSEDVVNFFADRQVVVERWFGNNKESSQ